MALVGSNYIRVFARVKESDRWVKALSWLESIRLYGSGTSWYARSILATNGCVIFDEAPPSQIYAFQLRVTKINLL